jgi:multiple sugar transport system permease protein
MTVRQGRAGLEGQSGVSRRSAALQGIPAGLYEAATIDGAGGWRRLFSITLPQLRNVTGVIVVLQLLASLKVFDQIYLLTAGR